MKIIGHRGAADIRIENTLESLLEAMETGCWAIECDVRLTADKRLVLCHDSDLKRLANSDLKIAESKLSELQVAASARNIELITLEEALSTVDAFNLVVELKAPGTADALHKILATRTADNIFIASFLGTELLKLKNNKIDLPLYLLERLHFFRALKLAKINKFEGLGLKYWLLNPLTYWLAYRNKVEIYVYTVNSRVLARLIRFFYPKVNICTDYPAKLVDLQG